ncbi:MAG: phage tail tube protein [Bradyrhizobium sp.]|uniref:phage tail tube protein n=1 Tax=Bradyrhizobium sp. TaxID=376 RepID=UPI003D109746
MTQATGSNTAVALFEESAFATDPGTPAGTKLYVVSSAIRGAQNLIDSNTLNSNRSRARPGRGNINVSGPINMEVSAENIGTILKHAMGQVSTSGSAPYTHVLTLGALPTSLLIEHDYGSAISGSGRYEKFNGLRIGRASFNFPSEGLITASFDTVGAKNTLASSALDASLTDNGHTPFSAFQGSFQEGGSSIAYIESATLEINNDLDESVYAYGGAGQRRAIPEGFSTVSGSITALFESAALLTKAINDTASSLVFTLSRGDGLGSAGNESIVFEATNLVYERTSAGIEGPRGLRITLPFKAFRSGSDNGLEVTIKNALSAI